MLRTKEELKAFIANFDDANDTRYVFARCELQVMELKEANDQLRSALKRALPILEDHAEDERTFWGDKHGYAEEAESIFKQAKAVLSII